MKRSNFIPSFSKTISITALVIAATLATSVTQASTSEFRLMSKMPGGSKLLKVDATSPVPFNKSYFELTKQQQDLFKAQFSELASSDRPPYPAKGLRAIYQPILKQNKSLANHGVLNMAIAVDENGNVDGVSVIETPSPELQRYATRAVKNIKFNPANCAGQPCAMNFPVRLVLQ